MTIDLPFDSTGYASAYNVAEARDGIADGAQYMVALLVERAKVRTLDLIKVGEGDRQLVGEA